MAELMLVNPKGRGRRKARRHNPATKTHKRKTRSRRKSNPVSARRVHHAAPRRHRRRNPIGGHGLAAQLKNALTGAIGGVAVDLIAGQVVPKLPVSMQGGYMGKVVKVGLAVGLGMIMQKTKMVKGATAARLVEGAMTVELYDLTRSVVTSAMPNLKLAEYIPVNGDDYLAEYIPVNGTTAERMLAGSSGEDRFAGDDEFAGMADDFGAVDPNPYDMAGYGYGYQ